MNNIFEIYTGRSYGQSFYLVSPSDRQLTLLSFIDITMEDILKINGGQGSFTAIVPELSAQGSSCSGSDVDGALSMGEELWLTEEEERELLQDSDEEETLIYPMEGIPPCKGLLRCMKVGDERFTCGVAANLAADAITKKEQAGAGVLSLNIPTVREGSRDTEKQSRESLIANDVAAINYSKVGKKVRRNKWKEKTKTLERELAKSGALNMKLQEECKKLRAEKKYLKTKIKTVKIQKRIKKLEARCDKDGETEGKEANSNLERHAMENNQWRIERSVKLGFRELYLSN